MNELSEFLQQRFYGNSVESWAIALGTALGVVVVVRILKAVFIARLRKVAERTPTRIDDVVLEGVSHTRWFFYGMLGVELGARVLRLPRGVMRIIDTALVLALLVQVGIWLQSMVRRTVELWREEHEGDEGKTGEQTMVIAIAFIARLIIWSLVFVLVLSNLGVEVNALLAGLGVGGVAAALAVQGVLGDLFASLSMYFDRPFDIGDFILVGDLMGNVEKIGLRTTRVRSLSGEQLIFPNSDLTSSRVRNYRRMEERRVVFQIGIVYGTPHAKVEQAPQIIREVIESVEETRFDRCHFKAYGDYALLFETVFYVLSREYNRYMDKQQEINLGIYRRFEEAGIEFAFPTRRLYLHQVSPEP